MYDTKLFKDICCEQREVNLKTLEEIIVLAVEIAREGREGRRTGTIFTVSDADEVLRHSRNLILDPVYGHDWETRRLQNPDMRETVKELSQLDGAFVISDDGVVVSACRYLDTSSEGIKMHLGLGSRHLAGASVSRQTAAVAVVVSESSVVRVFDNGELVSEIIPELWLMSRYSHHLEGPYRERSDAHVAVLSKAE
jgi:DNA integrity scanning protein DisA with diadenylate cyclase activity